MGYHRKTPVYFEEDNGLVALGNLPRLSCQRCPYLEGDKDQGPERSIPRPLVRRILQRCTVNFYTSVQYIYLLSCSSPLFTNIHISCSYFSIVTRSVVLGGWRRKAC